MRRWWTGVSGGRPRQQFAAVEAPAFVNAALLVGSSGITGAVLLNILESAATPAGPWKVYALSGGDRALPSSSSSGETCPSFDPNPVVHLNLDLDVADAAAVAQALAPITDITHVFYEPWSPCPEASCAVLRNVLSAVVPNCLVHVCLSRRDSIDSVEPLTGVPAAMRPCSEDEDLHRLEYPDLEDALLDELTASRSDGAAITWSVHSPTTIFGLYPRSSRNVIASLFIYAAICRKEGVALRWPGSRVAWEGFCDASDAEFIAEHALWAALEPNGKNNAFHFTNGDVFKWKQLWPALAKHFQVEWSGYDGEDKRFKLVEAMAGKEIEWAQIIQETELVQIKLDDITTWWLVDAVINTGKDHQLDSMKENNEHAVPFTLADEDFPVGKDGSGSPTESYTSGGRKVWNFGHWRNLLTICWLLSLLSIAATASTPHENGFCPIESIQSYIFPRKTCPVVHISAKHWFHAKRPINEVPSDSLLILLLLQCLKPMGFLFVLVSCITPLLSIWNLNMNMTATIFFWRAKVAYVWACNLISSIVYYTCWILFDLFQHYMETKETKSAWIIIYKNLFICMVHVLVALISGYRHRVAIQTYMHTRQATQMWFAFIISSVCWFWISAIFHFATYGLAILACIFMLPMYLTKWITA